MIFRCSQRLTTNGSLVEELTPTDFVVVERSKSTFQSTSFIHNKDAITTISSDNNSNMLTVPNDKINEDNSDSVFNDSPSNILQLKAANSDFTVSLHDSSFFTFRSNELANIESNIPTLEFVNNISVVPDNTDNVYDEHTSHRNDGSNEEIELENRQNSSFPSKTYMQCHEENLVTFNIKPKSVIENVKNFENKKSSFILESKVKKSISNIETSGEEIKFDSGLRR